MTNDTTLPVTAGQRAHLAFQRWDKPPHAPQYWVRLPSWVQEYAAYCIARTEARLVIEARPVAGEVETAIANERSRVMREALRLRDLTARTLECNADDMRTSEAIIRFLEKSHE